MEARIWNGQFACAFQLFTEENFISCAIFFIVDVDKKKWYVSGPIKINMNIKNKIEIEIE